MRGLMTLTFDFMALKLPCLTHTIMQ